MGYMLNYIDYYSLKYEPSLWLLLLLLEQRGAKRFLKGENIVTLTVVAGVLSLFQLFFFKIMSDIFCDKGLCLTSTLVVQSQSIMEMQ